MISRNPLDYAKWYLYEEDYFISTSGFLIYSYPRCKRHFVKEYERAYGFRWFLPDNDNTTVKLFDTGKPIVIVPRDIVPIERWQIK
jgi:hypothetical protein